MHPYFVSFRPDVEMDVNLPPFTPIETSDIRSLLKNAVGVLAPSYLTPQRYRAIVRYAQNWFPHLEARFEYCGKTKQILLFRRHGIRHPESILFDDAAQLRSYLEERRPPWEYPMVLKGDTGGGGSTVYPIYKAGDFAAHLTKLPADRPLLIQRWVEHGGKDLRVVVYGNRATSYFRIGDGRFYNNICRGGKLDHDSWPQLQKKGIEVVQDFCRQTHIDIAGFDLMFPDDGAPVFVEINFHFGRKGLGGKKGHREHMLRAIEEWRAACLESALQQEGTTSSA